jgi:protein O-mannosyl-transferase
MAHKSSRTKIKIGNGEKENVAAHATFSTVIAVGCLFVLPICLFGRAINFDFVDYDDPGYVQKNVHVQNGLTLTDMAWAWSTTRNGNWHPLMWWSYQLDSQLFGHKSWAYHATNVFYHALGTSVLYFALYRLGVKAGVALWVSAIYSIHPLHVESVAWISERKGILSTLFLFIALACYAEYCRPPIRRRIWLVGVGCAMVLGLMIKPMMVTLPVLLILLDIWPLRRLDINQMELPRVQRLLIEKLPFLAVAVAFSVLAIYAQSSAGAVSSTKEIPILDRVISIPAIYSFTLWRVAVPIDLSFFYTPPKKLMLWSAGGTILIAGVTMILWRRRRAMTPTLIGWLWFMIAMLPLSGVIPLGMQWTADRYTDVPAIGIYLAVATTIALAIKSIRWPSHERHTGPLGRQGLIYFLAVISLVFMGSMSHVRLGAWRNSETLIAATLDHDPTNHAALSLKATRLITEGEYQRAYEVVQIGLSANDQDPTLLDNYAYVLDKLGRRQEAIQVWEQLLQANPKNASILLRLGNAYRDVDSSRALDYYQQSLSINEDSSETHNNLGILLARNNTLSAEKHYLRAIEIWPENANAHCNLAYLLARQGKLKEAIERYRLVLEFDPQNPIASNNLQLLSKTATN